MIPITYVIGDATVPIGDPIKDICLCPHVCNDSGGWGRGFVLAISEKDKAPEFAYRSWYRGEDFSKRNVASIYESGPFGLGEIQIAEFGPWPLHYVVNMIGQHDVRTIDGVPPVRYEAIGNALQKLAEWIGNQNKPCFINAPMFGAGLAGGEWGKIEKIIIDKLCAKDVNVTISRIK